MLVEIQLDKPRHLLRTIPGMKQFEKITGKSQLKGFPIEDLTTEDLSVLIWSLLIHEDKGLKVEQIDEVIARIDAVELLNKIAECLKS
jgi:hypothetical protein